MKTTFRTLDTNTIKAFAARHDAEEDAQDIAAELLHVREQRDRPQALNTALTQENRAAKGVLTLRWKRIGEHNLSVPARANPGDAGIDLSVIVDEKTRPEKSWTYSGGPKPTIEVFDDSGLIVFRTGWAVEIPSGWYGQIVVRSSIGKAGWDLESSGVIDSGYRGEIMMPMVYRGDGIATVEHGQRMAQMLLLPVPHAESVEVESLSDTVRSAGGFGSTGR